MLQKYMMRALDRTLSQLSTTIVSLIFEKEKDDLKFYVFKLNNGISVDYLGLVFQKFGLKGKIVT